MKHFAVAALVAALCNVWCMLLSTEGLAHALSQPPTAAPGDKHRIAIIGAGSSGIFAAASILDTIKDQGSSDRIEVKVYESTNEALRTIRRSQNDGILYDASKRPRDILNIGYPRGRKEVTSLLTKHFPPAKQQLWFEDRGVQFRTKQDGCMVVDDDASVNVCDAILRDGVRELIESGAKITDMAKRDIGGFRLVINGGSRTEHCDCVILATGNSRLGHQLASSFGHTVSAPVRSCFAFTLEDTTYASYLEDGVGYLLPHVRLSYKVKLGGQKKPRVFKSEGPARMQMQNGIISLDGMAALSLSSSAAHDLHGAKYAGTLFVHFCPDHMDGKVEKMEEYLWQYRQDYPRVVVGERCPLLHHYVNYDEYNWETESFKTVTSECVPSALWQGLTQACGAPPGSPWSKMSPKKVRKLAETIVGCPFNFSGRDATNESPFINTGGILLNEIDMSTMESKIVDGLYCCGQALDGDASHNSYSLMRDFATGKVAGDSAATYALCQLEDAQEHVRTMPAEQSSR